MGTTPEKCEMKPWIDRLAPALAWFAEVQEPYVQGYYRQSPHMHVLHAGLESSPPAFPLDDLRMLYARARHASILGEAGYCAPLRAALDPARYILLSHPVLARAVGRVFGRDEFWMQILNGGSQTSPAAHIPQDGQPERDDAALAGTVLPGGAHLPRAVCRGACRARAAPGTLGPLHRQVRGLTDHRGSLHRGRPSQEFDGFDMTPELTPAALAQARDAFLDRQGERYRRIAPVAGRVAEALARDGRFAIEDRILDVAIALERLYELERRGGSFQLKTRAAYFLESDIDARWQVFEDVDALFDARSGIIHRRSEQPSTRTRVAAFKSGFEQSRRSLFRLLEEGAPADWNELAKRETDSSHRGSGDGLGMTTPGYRNRNDQVVVERTDLPGNDHIQRIYVLDCRHCRHRYGSNGSDIWHRRCPKCGDGLPGRLRVGALGKTGCS